jgi:hypothetical protein
LETSISHYKLSSGEGGACGKFSSLTHQCKAASLPAVGDDVSEVDDPLRVPPLVVVPGDDLDHVVPHDHGERGVDCGGDVGAPEVDGDERLVADIEDALELAGGAVAERLVDLLSEGLVGDLDDEVDDGDVRGGDAERDPVELALEVGEHERGGLGGAGRGGHDVERGGAGRGGWRRAASGRRCRSGWWSSCP